MNLQDYVKKQIEMHGEAIAKNIEWDKLEQLFSQAVAIETPEKTEADYFAERKWAAPRVGDVVVKKGRMYHKETGEELI